LKLFQFYNLVKKTVINIKLKCQLILVYQVLHLLKILNQNNTEEFLIKSSLKREIQKNKNTSLINSQEKWKNKFQINKEVSMKCI